MQAFADSAQVPVVVQCGNSLWQSLLVWLSAVAASWGAVFIQNRLDRNKVRDDLLQAKRIAILPEAYERMKRIESDLFQKSDMEVLEYLVANEAWLFANAIFLPPGYANMWLSIRNALGKIGRMEDAHQRGAPGAWTANQIGRVQEQMNDWVASALQAVYKAIPGAEELKPVAASPGPADDRDE